MTRVVLLLLSITLGTSLVLGQQDVADIVRPPDEPAYSRAAYEAGRRDAVRDIGEDRLVIEIYGGPPAPWDADWAKLLRERFRIELRERGCVVDYAIRGHERGYNEISFAEVQRRFGRDVVRETRAEAEKQWYANRKK
jgi:hypothetical protein